MCLNILREDWNPILAISSVIYGLIHLFMVRFFLVLNDQLFSLCFPLCPSRKPAYCNISDLHVHIAENQPTVIYPICTCILQRTSLLEYIQSVRAYCREPAYCNISNLHVHIAENKPTVISPMCTCKLQKTSLL